MTFRDQEHLPGAAEPTTSYRSYASLNQLIILLTGGLKTQQTKGFPDNSALAGNNASFLYGSPQNTSFLKDLSLPPLQMFPSLSFW